jgi:protein dithiol:quinone oxidoreductase
MKLPLPEPRLTYLIIAFFTLMMMIIAIFYFQKALGLLPCPMCVAQRGFTMAVGVIAMAAFLHNPGILGQRLYSLMIIGAALGGGSVSARQVWLQSLPEDQIPACGPTLDWMLTANFPMQEIVAAMFFGEGSCAEIHWQLMGLSIPGWTLVAFILLAAAGSWQLLRTLSRQGA